MARTKRAARKNQPARPSVAVKQSKTKGAEKAKAAKKRRFKPGMLALREIRRYQQSFDLLLRLAPFQRLVREITEDVSRCKDMRMTKDSLLCIQHAAEIHMTTILEASNLAAIHGGRVTLQKKDIQFVMQLRRLFGFVDGCYRKD